jgi:hypothetical protein
MGNHIRKVPERRHGLEEAGLLPMPPYIRQRRASLPQILIIGTHHNFKRYLSFCSVLEYTQYQCASSESCTPKLFLRGIPSFNILSQRAVRSWSLQGARVPILFLFCRLHVECESNCWRLLSSHGLVEAGDGFQPHERICDMFRQPRLSVPVG